MPNSGNEYSLPEHVAAAVVAGTNVVKALREHVGYSIEDLALTCGLAISEISAIEAGEDDDPSRLRRVAVALRVPEQALLGR